MEEHRLQPMKEGYDERIFNQIYKDTNQLRKKLAYDIDARRFGVDYNEVLSWFDVKFIYTFNKYYGEMPNDRLKGYIINSLQTFKYRILRMSYSNKVVLNNTVDISDPKNSDLFKMEEESSDDLYLSIALSYLKQQLSKDAFFLLELILNPPHYIIHKLNEGECNDLNKIPNSLIAEYLNQEEITPSYIDNLKKEIRKATRNCKNFFNQNQLIIS
jgi:hypothetical protein